MVKYFNEQAFEAIARNILKRFNPDLLSNPQAIPIEDIIEKMYGLRIEYQYIRNNGRILGETIFDDVYVGVYDMEKWEYVPIFVTKGTIIIDARLLTTRYQGRLRFTCAHELAHWLIHHDVFSGTGDTAALTKEGLKSSDSNPIIERQADILASTLLMPAGHIKLAFNRNFRTSTDIVSDMATTFQVSKQAMSIRLKTCGLI